MGRLDGDTLRRIWRKTRKQGQCRIWTGATAGGKDGRYPYMKLNGQSVGVHRVIHAHYCGPIPPRHDVHHTCPNTLCIVPHHTQAVQATRHNKMGRWRGHVAARGHAS